MSIYLVVYRIAGHKDWYEAQIEAKSYYDALASISDDADVLDIQRLS